MRRIVNLLVSSTVDHHEVSAQEVAYRIPSLFMKQLSRCIVFVDTNAKKQRISLLKKPDAIEHLDDDDDTDVFQKSLVDRFKHRPEQLKTMNLAEFAATYSTCYSSTGDDDNEDELPNSNKQTSSKKITLSGGYGQMHERKKTAVIRFSKYNKDTDTSNWYRGNPWCDEDTDILGGFASFAEHYDIVKRIVIDNEMKYTAEQVDDMSNDEDSRPESMPGVKLPLVLRIAMHI